MKKISLEEIISIVSKSTGISEKHIDISSKHDDFDNWDSIAHVKIFLEIEKILKKKVKTSKMGDLTSIKLMLNYFNQTDAIS